MVSVADGESIEVSEVAPLMFYCDRITHATPMPATRLVLLKSKYIQMARHFCDDCARDLCEPKPEGRLQGTDMGPIIAPKLGDIL